MAGSPAPSPRREGRTIVSNPGAFNDGDPSRTPYVSTERYERPKDDFRTIARCLERTVDVDTPHHVVDVGCANGELLYHLRGRFPNWRLEGYDRNEQFLETGRAFPGLEGVGLHRADLYEIEGEHDIVIATCFLSLFPEIEPPLEKLLSLCRPGGHVLATGLFNPFDVEVRVRFRDGTDPQAGDEWRTDFNRHSQARIREQFGSRVTKLEFEPCEYDVEIPHDPDNPVRVWTMRDEEGNTLLINGAWQIANQTLMVIQK